MTSTRHVAPEGVLIVEPWWFQENFLDGHVSTAEVRGDDRTIMRLSRTVREGASSRMDIHVVVADAAGIRHFSEVHHHTPFAREDYLTALEHAGCPSR